MKKSIQLSSSKQEVRSICSLSEAKTNSTTKPTLRLRSVSAMAIMLYFAFLIFNSPQARAQIISTIAGNGTGWYSGDGGQATAATLNQPFGVAVAAAGNMYIADYNNSVIRKVSTAGIISTIAGNGTAGYSGDGSAATAAQLNNPTGLALDAIGNVYIADWGNSVIRKVNTAGIISTYAGNGTAAYTGDGGQATAAALADPTGVAVDAAGNVYIADYSNNRIRKVSTAGIISTIAGNGTGAYTGDGGQATAATLNSPYGVAVDAVGNMYIADWGNSVIRKVSAASIINTIAGTGTAAYSGDGGQATAATLNNPQGVAFDASGNVYIADRNNSRIRKVSTAGIIGTYAGNGTFGYTGDGGQATAAALAVPNGVAVDAAGNMYIADMGNNRIRKVCVSTCAGAGIEQFSIENDAVRIWPNPTNSIINLSISQFDNLKMQDVEVTNTLGEVVYHSQIGSSSNYQIDVSGLQAGVYFIRVGKTTQKFIKQ